MSLLTAFASVGGLVLLIWTRSRGAFLSFLVGGVLWMVFTKRFKWLMVAGLIAGGAFLLVPKSMIIHQNAEGQEQSIVERYYLWDRALNVIKAKPLTGTGPMPSMIKPATGGSGITTLTTGISRLRPKPVFRVFFFCWHFLESIFTGVYGIKRGEWRPVPTIFCGRVC
jgi:hypothetical protein